MSLDCTYVPNYRTCWLTCRCHGNISSCCSPPRHQIRAYASVPYRVAWMLNQLRRGHRAWPMFELKSGAAMAAPAAPMPLPLVCHDMMICCDIRISITFVTAWKKQYHDFLKRCPWVMNLSGSSNWEWAYFQEFQISLVCCHWHCYSCCPLPTN